MCKIIWHIIIIEAFSGRLNPCALEKQILCVHPAQKAEFAAF
jgi:hypothetical protein